MVTISGSPLPSYRDSGISIDLSCKYKENDLFIRTMVEYE